jgi:hypothetical protein
MQFISNNPRTIKQESNDCTVRATSLAINKPYQDVHGVFAKHGRRDGKGVTLATLIAVLIDLTKNNLKIVASHAIRRETLASFIKTHPKGKYLVIKRGHAFAVIDGVAHDAHSSCCGARSIVKYAYKLGD